MPGVRLPRTSLETRLSSSQGCALAPWRTRLTHSRCAGAQCSRGAQRGAPHRPPRARPEAEAPPLWVAEREGLPGFGGGPNGRPERRHCSLADAADQIAEAGAIHRPACGAAEIRVDHGYVPEAVAPSKVDERVLATLALEVLLHLRSRRLTDVDDGATFQRLLRKLTKRHR